VGCGVSGCDYRCGCPPVLPCLSFRRSGTTLLFCPLGNSPRLRNSKREHLGINKRYATRGEPLLQPRSRPPEPSRSHGRSLPFAHRAKPVCWYSSTAPAMDSKTVDTYVRAQCSDLPQIPIKAAPCSGGTRKKRRYPQGKSHSSARSSPLQQLFGACFPLFSLQAPNMPLAKCCPPIKPSFATVKQLVQSFRYQKRQLNFAMDVQPFTDP
jgi:hypothetical protein